MTAEINELIFETLSPELTPILGEVEQDTYPYLCYDGEVEATYTKDGKKSYKANIIFSLVGEDFVVLDEQMAIIRERLDELRSDKIDFYFKSLDRQKLGGIWTFKIGYYINQKF